MNNKTYSIEIDGKTITAEFNDLAEQAHGSVLLRSGNTVVLATAVMSEEAGDGSWFPLRVDAKGGLPKKLFSRDEWWTAQYVRFLTSESGTKSR